MVLSFAVFSGNSQEQPKGRHVLRKSQQISQSELIASITNNFGSKVRVVVDSQPYKTIRAMQSIFILKEMQRR